VMPNGVWCNWQHS